MKMPAWAFNYNSTYSATYSDVGNCSVYSPYTAYMSLNSAINKQQMPAFVRNAKMGCCGNGIMFYGYPAASNTYKELTQVWAMAIPDSMAWPVGLLTLGISIVVPSPPDFVNPGPSFMLNSCLYIDTDHILKYGHTYRGTGVPPQMVHNFGIDMSAYMYPNTVQPTDAYCGHMYAFMYNTASNEYELFVDNTANAIANINKALMIGCGLEIMNMSIYNESLQHLENAVYNGYYCTGVGAYFSNWSGTPNPSSQGNVYMSDWYGWVESYNSTVLNDLLTFNWSQARPVISNSSLGTFDLCHNLRQVIVPGALKDIPPYFINSSNLTSITFQNGVNNIGALAIRSASDLAVTIPRSVHFVSTDAVNSPNINLSPVTHNMPLHNNMFNGINAYSFYEQPERLVVENMPTKQLRPMHYAYKDNVDIYPSILYSEVNDLYSSPSGISMQYNQANITQAGDTYALTWNNINTSIIFDDPNVYKGSHTNTVIATPFNMTNDGFDVKVRSLEFTDLCIETHCTFLNTPFIVTNINDNLRCSIVGCLLNNVDTVEIPDIIDNAYIVENICLNQPFPSGEADAQYALGAPIVPNINIKVPYLLQNNNEYLAGQVQIHTTPGAYDFAPFCNIHIHDGHAVRLTANGAYTSQVPNRRIVVSNVNRVAAGGLSVYNVAFENCYNVVGYPYMGLSGIKQVPVDINMLCNNYIVLGGNYESVDFSTLTELRFNHTRHCVTGNLLSPMFGKNIQTALLLEDNEEADVVHGWSNAIAYPYHNIAEKAALRNLANYCGYSTMVGVPTPNYDSSYGVKTSGCILYNCTLPADIFMHDVDGKYGSYNYMPLELNTCHGDINIHYEGYMLGRCNVKNHDGEINCFINSTLLASHSTSDIFNNCHINQLCTNMFMPTHISPRNVVANYWRAYTNVSGMWLAATACTMQNICINDNITMLFLNNCTVEHIENPSGVVSGLLLINCTFNTPINHVIANIANCVHMNKVNALADTELHINVPTRHYIDRIGHPILENISTTNLVLNYGRYPYEPSFKWFSPEYKTIHMTSDALYCYAGYMFSGLSSAEQSVYTEQVGSRYMPVNYSFPRCRKLYINCNLDWPEAEVPAARDLNITGTENCLALIGDFTNYPCNATIHVHPNCSVSIRGASAANISIVKDGGGNRYPVDANVTYKDNSTTRILPDGFCNLYEYINVNIVFNDGTEEPTNDFCLIPNTAMTPPGVQLTNTYHILLANGIQKRIIAPYARVTAYNSAAPRITAANYYPSVAVSGQQFVVTKADKYCACINGSNAGLSSYKNEIRSIEHMEPIDTLLFAGSYNRWCGCNSLFAKTLIATNNIASVNTFGGDWGLNAASPYTYIRDDAAEFYAYTSYTVYNGVCVGILDFSRSRKSRYALGAKCILDSTVEMIMLSVGAYTNMIANNAVKNCPQLYWVDMNLINSTNFRINDDAFIDCPLLSEVYVPRNTKYIGRGAFNRTGLKRIVVPATCTFGVNAVPADCTISYY
jgi:hypothetical protein